MNTEDKKQFITNLMDSLKQSVLERVEKMPEEWDGIELRQFIVDYTEDQVRIHKDMLKGKRLRDYKNEVLVRNL